MRRFSLSCDFCSALWSEAARGQGPASAERGARGHSRGARARRRARHFRAPVQLLILLPKALETLVPHKLGQHLQASASAVLRKKKPRPACPLSPTCDARFAAAGARRTSWKSRSRASNALLSNAGSSTGFLSPSIARPGRRAGGGGGLSGAWARGWGSARGGELLLQ